MPTSKITFPCRMDPEDKVEIIFYGEFMGPIISVEDRGRKSQVNLEIEDAITLAQRILIEHKDKVPEETAVSNPYVRGRTGVEVIHEGGGFTFTKDDRDFYVLNNMANMKGAYMCGASPFEAFARDVAEAAGLTIAGPKLVTQRNPNPRYSNLSEQAQLIYRHMDRAGSISAREAIDDHGITSATLARRICDIEEEGFEVIRERKQHPITGKRYTRYSLA